MYSKHVRKRERKDRKFTTTLLAILVLLVPSYALFNGTLDLDPKGNLEYSLLIGWAFSKFIIESTSMYLRELKSRILKLLSSI